MKRLSPILGSDGKPISVTVRPRDGARRAPQAKYDAAGDSPDNRKHWAQADGLSANTANNASVRRTLRNRSRYEFDNNGYCEGLVLTLANDLIGTGPTLQVLTEDDDANRQVEARFKEWCEATGFAEKLHTMKQAKTRDGETFAKLISNPQLPDVQLDLDVFEADLCTTWTLSLIGMPADFDSGPVDGIRLNAQHQPVEYFILKNHPGDAFGISGEYDTVPAADMIHWFRRDRPRQFRGVPEITASLPLYAMLRRYTLATVLAAEIAASFAAMLESTAPVNDPDDADESTDDPFSTLEIERGMMTQLPKGYKANQLKPEQPTATYGDFKRELLKEIGRGVNAPFNVISGDSSLYNYSSARLDHLLYRSAQRVERDHCRRIVLDRVFAAWYAEARLIPLYLPAGLPDTLPHAWYWPGSETIDPLKESLADTNDLTNGTTTLAERLAEYGQDWQAILQQRSREMKEMERLGLPLPEWLQGGAAGAAQNPDGQDRQGNQDAKDGAPGAPGAMAHALPMLPRADGNDEEPRDKDGKWASAGGSSESKEQMAKRHDKEGKDQSDRHDREEKEQDSRHEKEDSHVEKATDKEDADTERARDKEDAAHEKERDRGTEQLDGKHEKENSQVESQRDREDKATDAKREKEDERLQSQRDREDAKTDSRRESEDSKTEDKREKEDDALSSSRDKEDTSVESRHDKQTAEMEGRQEKEAKDLDDKHDREDTPQEQMDRESADLADRHEKETDKLQGEHSKEKDGIQAKRDAEDKATEQKRDAEDRATQARRDKEDADLATARDAEDKGIESKRDAEDSSRSDARDKEDSERSDRHEAEHAAHQSAHDRAELERQAKRDKEDEAINARRGREDLARDERQAKERREREERHQKERDDLYEKQNSELEKADGKEKKASSAAWLVRKREERAARNYTLAMSEGQPRTNGHH